MIFITLIKFKKTAREVANIGNTLMKIPPAGVKLISNYWTLGRFDAVWIYEAPDEKVSLDFVLSLGDVADTETLVGVPRDEAIKMGLAESGQIP